MLLGASALSDRSPVFVKLLFREGRVKVVRFIFESTYQAEQEEFVEGLSATREVFVWWVVLVTLNCCKGVRGPPVPCAVWSAEPVTF